MTAPVTGILTSSYPIHRDPHILLPHPQGSPHPPTRSGKPCLQSCRPLPQLSFESDKVCRMHRHLPSGRPYPQGMPFSSAQSAVHVRTLTNDHLDRKHLCNLRCMLVHHSKSIGTSICESKHPKFQYRGKTNLAVKHPAFGTPDHWTNPHARKSKDEETVTDLADDPRSFDTPCFRHALPS